MSGHGLVTDVERVSAKQNEPVWQIITDAQNRAADGLNRCAVWIMRLDRCGKELPHPAIGDAVTWDASHVWWTPANPLSPTLWAKKVDHEFDPSDPRLFTG